MKIFLFVVRLFKISRCRRIKIKNYFTGEFSPNYICNSRQMLCCFNFFGKECLDSYSILSDDMIRCKNEKAIRRAMLEAER